MANTIRVGTSGAWTELPIGAEWVGWKQQRKQTLVDVPLAHGAIDVADGMWKPLIARVRICLYNTTPLLHQTDLVTVYQTLMQNQSELHAETHYIAVFEGGASCFEVKYDKVAGIDVTFVKGVKWRHSYATFLLSCHTKPYMQDMFNLDGS